MAKDFNHLPNLKKRVFRAKNSVLDFLCPLCGIKRALHYHSRLKLSNYLQILSCTLLFTMCTYWKIGYKGALSFFIFWGFFEFFNKSFFRKEIPCPDCGFDATWYKRDVRVAKKLVSTYWDEKLGKINPIEISDDDLNLDQSSNVEDPVEPA